ncbi:uncharacterized protein EV420DRAFT_1137497 [Desarmillaria tabescens]|uniref:Uncharacterized protein n=1 Tax=Armillaria tabescens TaxID=1929756 RepID=A0AA39MMT1_ARMTA|nr:uncharacterized protein EV420DRAFT_1137497 [Desarmillaria tabescens]KAK0440027.1 hypothetical protein EV420DRAFT_1137497 [Desarmillaria tabescens]
MDVVRAHLGLICNVLRPSCLSWIVYLVLHSMTRPFPSLLLGVEPRIVIRKTEAGNMTLRSLRLLIPLVLVIQLLSASSLRDTYCYRQISLPKGLHASISHHTSLRTERFKYIGLLLTTLDSETLGCNSHHRSGGRVLHWLKAQMKSNVRMSKVPRYG